MVFVQPAVQMMHSSGAVEVTSPSFNVGGSLGLVGVVDEVDVAAGDARHDFRSFKAEALEDEGRFRGGRALGGRHDVQTTLLVEMRAGNGGNDAVGVGVLMTKNESGHFEAFLKRG